MKKGYIPMRKFTAKALLLLLAAALLTGCGNSTATVETESTIATEAAVTETETTDPYADDLPEMNYEGYTFTIHSQSRTWYHGSWTTEEATGEVLNDAIYNRNLKVAERFNIQLDELVSTSNDDAKTVIMAGDDAYDIIHCGQGVSFAQQGYVLNLSLLPYINVEKPYWDQKIIDTLTFAGKSFFAVGASDLTGYDYIHMLIFNKDMVTDHSLTSPYDLVNEGGWTYDAYAEMAAAVTLDVNGDGTMDKTDTFGFLSQPKHVLPGFWIGAGLETVNKDADGNPVFNMASDTRFIEAVDKVFQITYDNNSWFFNKAVNNADTTLNDMFAAGQALFMDMTFFYVEDFRDMDADFGIIPYPKLDEAQDGYHARVEGINLVSVPVTAANPERTSVLLEALTAESARTVIPAYYEVALKAKYARDNESQAMLDLIFNNRIMDLGDSIWCANLRDGILLTMFQNNDRALTSKIASIQTKMDTIIADAVEAYASIQ